MNLLKGDEIEQVIRKAGKKIFHMCPKMSRDSYVIWTEHSFDDGKWSFNQRSDTTDSSVSSFIFRWDWMTTNRSLHGFIRWCEGYRSEISFIPVHRFTLLREIDLAVVHRCGWRIEPTDELVFLIDDRVKLESEFRFRTFLTPGSVLASPGLCFISPRLVCRSMARIRRDERCILNGTALYRVSFLIQLALEFLPDKGNFSLRSQLFLECPDGRSIRDLIRISEKMPER